MGNASGKSVITEHRAVESAKPDQPTDGNLEVINQSTGGVGPNWDFKPIDEPEETPQTLINGHTEGEQVNGAAEDQVNGDVSTTENTSKANESGSEKTPKKHKNPLIRIPTRLSKINFSFNLGHKKRSKTTKESEATQDAEVAEPKPDDSVIAGVADTLVQEVITSATATHASTLEEQKETPHSPELVDHVSSELIDQSQPPAVVEASDTQEVPQEMVTEVPIITNKEEIFNGSHESYDQTTNHVADSNNTNSTALEYVNGDSHPVGENDAIVAKLTSLELTNGHSDHMVEVPVALNGQDDQ